VPESALHRLAGTVKDRLTRLLRLHYERGLRDTGGELSSDELGFDDPDFFHYQASAWTALRRALDGRSVSSDDVFLDLGCGKGRVLWLAARHYPFRRVIGIEIVDEMVDFARANLEANRHRFRATDAIVEAANAAQYEIPDDVTFVYMFSPFGGDVFRAAIENLVASLDRRPRPMTLIYANPELGSVIDDCGRFELVEVLKPRLAPERRTGAWVSVYEARAEPEPSAGRTASSTAT
jgi:SAM-dependent methyltransferase